MFLSVTASASVCCDEMLLADVESVSPCYNMAVGQFDKRMAELGFTRSIFQSDTPADGNCGIHALLDQLNLPHNMPSMFDREDCVFARYFNFIKLVTTQCSDVNCTCWTSSLFKTYFVYI